MQSLIALKTLHITALLALLLVAAGLAARLVHCRRAGNVLIHNSLMQRPALWGWVVMAASLAILPFSGWWLIHGLGLSLGQGWILASSLLYTLGIGLYIWLVLRLLAGTGKPRLTLILALATALCFVAIAVLLVARPG